jgi:hypothetical protein
MNSGRLGLTSLVLMIGFCGKRSAILLIDFTENVMKVHKRRFRMNFHLCQLLVIDL